MHLLAIPYPAPDIADYAHLAPPNQVRPRHAVENHRAVDKCEVIIGAVDARVITSLELQATMELMVMGGDNEERKDATYFPMSMTYMGA